MKQKLTIPVRGMFEVPAKAIIRIGLKPWQYNVDGDVVSSLLEAPERGLILIPRNFKKLVKHLKRKGYEPVFKDERLTKKMEKPFVLSEEFNLRDYQAKAVRELLKTLSGSPEASALLKAPPSFGKSYILPYIVSKVGQKTLVIVDRVDLVKQMFDEFSKNVADGDFHILNKKDQRIADVNITTFQFLLRNPKLVEKLAEEIGFVVVDEAHLISIGAFTQIVNKLPAKYRLGLSATPTRSDGLTGALYDVMTNNIINGENPDLLRVKFMLLDRPQYLMFGPELPPSKAWPLFLSSADVVADVVTFAKFLLGKERAILIYSTYSRAQKALKNALKKIGVSSEIINQQTPKEERVRILAEFQERKIDVIISGTILQKGVSIHRLDTVLNVGNHTKESLEQLIGRLRREHPDKKDPLYIDFAFDGKAFWKALNRWSILEKLSKEHKDKLIHLNKIQVNKILEREGRNEYYRKIIGDKKSSYAYGKIATD